MKNSLDEFKRLPKPFKQNRPMASNSNVVGWHEDAPAGVLADKALEKLYRDDARPNAGGLLMYRAHVTPLAEVQSWLKKEKQLNKKEGLKTRWGNKEKTRLSSQEKVSSTQHTKVDYITRPIPSHPNMAMIIERYAESWGKRFPSTGILFYKPKKTPKIISGILTNPQMTVREAVAIISRQRFINSPALKREQKLRKPTKRKKSAS